MMQLMIMFDAFYLAKIFEHWKITVRLYQYHSEFSL